MSVTRSVRRGWCAALLLVSHRRSELKLAAFSCSWIRSFLCTGSSEVQNSEKKSATGCVLLCFGLRSAFLRDVFLLAGRQVQVLRGSSAGQRETRTCWGASSFPSRASLPSLCQELSSRVCISAGFLDFPWLGWRPSAVQRRSEELQSGLLRDWFFSFCFGIKDWQTWPFITKGLQEISATCCSPERKVWEMLAWLLGQ